MWIEASQSRTQSIGQRPLTPPRCISTLSLWHPFTPRSIGWKAEDVAISYSRPHIAALKDLSTRYGIGCRVEYLTDAVFPSSETRDGVEWRYWPRSLRASERAGEYRHELSITGLLATIARPADATIINTSGFGGTYARALARASRFRHRRYIAMVGGLFASPLGKQREYFNQASAIAVHTEALRNFLIDEGLPATKVVVVPLGVDTAQFAPPSTQRLPDQGPVLLFVGRLTPSKRVDAAIRATADLRQVRPRRETADRRPVFRPRVRGGASRVGREALDRRRSRVRGTGTLFGASKSLSGRRPSRCSERGRRVWNGDRGEHGALVRQRWCSPRLEARSEIVSEGRDGMLATAEGFSRTVAELVEDSERLRAMGKAARAKVLERYTSKVTASALEDLLLRDDTRDG